MAVSAPQPTDMCRLYIVELSQFDQAFVGIADAVNICGKNLLSIATATTEGAVRNCICHVGFGGSPHQVLRIYAKFVATFVRGLEVTRRGTVRQLTDVSMGINVLFATAYYRTMGRIAATFPNSERPINANAGV